MEYKVVERDFISRTLDIVDQYDALVVKSVPEESRFEVTLLLNCLLGLIVLPFEHKKRAQGNQRFPEMCQDDLTLIKDLDDQWGLKRLTIVKFKLDGQDVSFSKVTLRQIVAMIRHAIAHSQFGNGHTQPKPIGTSVDYRDSPVSGVKSQITRINFVNKHGSTEFEASIAVEDLKLFTTKFARTVLEEMTDPDCA